MLGGAAVATALAAPAVAGTLRYAEDRAPAIVHPLFTTSMSEARLNELLFDGLFHDDRELRAAPDLVESFTLADDKRSMTLTLRSDARWHDGKPVTADDVVFTLQAMANPATASTERGRVGFIDSVVADDPRTVTLRFVAPEASPQDKLYIKILPAHRFDGSKVDRSGTFRTGPVGSGDWQLASFNDDSSITLSAVEGRGVGIEQVVLREVSDKNYQAKLLLYESLEALVRVLPRDLATLQNDRKVELYPYQTNSWWYLGFQHGRSHTRSPEVRQALASMIDVPQLLAPIGTGDLLTGPFVRSSPFYNHDVPAVSHDPDAAAELLTAAGYTYSGRWTAPDGKPLTLKVATVSNLETAQDVLINLQSQLQSRGIAVEPEFLTPAEWKQRVWRDRDFDVVLSQWSFDRNEDIYEQFHSRGARNFLGYANRKVDEHLDQARTSVDPQEKKALLREAHALIAADHPMVFLWTLDSYAAMSTKVKRVVVHPFYFFTWAADWTL
jgi:peptide/nickel transport system substrate-binding protein